MDAVNEFKGEWKHKDTDMRTDAIYFRYFDTRGYYYYGDDMPFHYEFVCNKQEFNDLVSQLETNFGEVDPVLAAYYRHCTDKELLTKSTKELGLMDEESNQCKISKIGNVLHNMSCSMDDEDEQNEFGGYAYFCCDLADELRKSECAVDTTKTVFTQAMADNGELPPIGSKVQFVGNDDYLVEFNINDGDELECICHTKDFEGDSIGVYRHKDGFSVSILNQLIKPIDTRTDKEKCYDDLSKIGITQQSLIDSIIAGNIHGVKWVGE